MKKSPGRKERRDFARRNRRGDGKERAKLHNGLMKHVAKKGIHWDVVVLVRKKARQLKIAQSVVREALLRRDRTKWNELLNLIFHGNKGKAA